MGKSLQHTIIKTGVLTLYFAFVTFSYGIALFGFAFPRAMAQFGDALGAHSSAAMFYERAYKREPTTENLYLVLDRYILARNHRQVVKSGDKFFDMADHDAVIAGVNEYFMERAGENKLNRLRWCNEKNRLETALIVSLIKTGRAERAATELGEMLSEEKEPDMQQPNHAFFAFVVLGANTDSLKELTFVPYVNRFADYYKEHTDVIGERVFALDFLMTAFNYLGDRVETAHYARLLNEYIS